MAEAGPAPLSRKKLFGSHDTEVMTLLLAGGVRSAVGTADGARMHTQWGVALNIVRSTSVLPRSCGASTSAPPESEWRADAEFSPLAGPIAGVNPAACARHATFRARPRWLLTAMN